MYLILFGAPGVGKGTQAELISKEFNIPQISTGEMLRSAVANKTELGLKAKSIMDKGELVSDDIILGIIEERILQDDCNNGLILDGFPRTIPQAEGLTKLLLKHNFPDFKCIEIKVTDQEIIDRLLKRGRMDDNEETIRKRLDVYKELTAPVKKYYEQHDGFFSVDGNKSISDVYKDIKSIIIKEDSAH